MKYFTLIVALLASASIASAVKHHEGVRAGLCSLDQADQDTLSAIVAAQDDPQGVLAVLKGCQRLEGNGHATELLLDMIRLDRRESFKAMFPLLPAPEFNDWRVMFVNAAVDGHRLEIADYLLDQGVPAPRWFEGFLDFGNPMGHADFKPDMEQLKVLVGRHPDLINQMVPPPKYIRYLDDADAINLMMDFIAHCRHISPVFAAELKYNPTSILDSVIWDGSLSDADKARVIRHFAERGATFNQEGLDDLKKFHPELVESYRAYWEQVHPDIKGFAEEIAD